MTPHGAPPFASAALRRPSRARLRPQVAALDGASPRRPSPFSAFSLAPRLLLHSPLAAFLERERRCLAQPLLAVKRIVLQTVQDGVLRSVFQLLSRKAVDRRGPKKARGPERSTRRCRAEARRCWERAKRLEKEMDLEGAIECLERAVRLQPRCAAYLCLLSKQYTDMSFAPGVSRERARECNERALEIAERAVALDPEDPVAHIAASVSTGRLAYYSDNRAKIELAREAEETLQRALRLDGDSDVGHHLMGRFQYEMAGLSVICRAFVRLVYGASLSPGSYAAALEEFRKADALNPGRVIHKVLLAKTYAKLGQREKAVSALQDGLELEVTDINDHLERLDGERLMRSLARRTNRGREKL